jgi:hypothetical protein
MDGTHDSSEAAAAGEGARFDSREAAMLLKQTRRHAQRQLEPTPPWLLVIRAVLVLAAFGAVWLSVRGQHPYNGPTVAAIVAVVAFGFGNFGATVAVARRATAGVTGRSRLRPAEMMVMASVWVGVFVVMGALAAAGVSNGVVYGVYPATVPLMVAGLAWAGIMATRADWRAGGTALAVAVVGAAGALAGPAGAWAVVGVGLCLTLLATAAAIAWKQRRVVVAL